MQTFIDTVTQKIWQYEDDVIVTDTAGVYSFTAAHGMPLPAPTTLQPYVIPAPTSAQLLAQAQVAQTASFRQSYLAAISANISFTDAAGVTDTYQADPASVAVLNNCLSGFRVSATVPTGFYWRSATNQNNPFTYADLEGLASAMTTRGFTNYAHLQTQIASVMAATTVSAVDAVTW